MFSIIDGDAYIFGIFDGHGPNGEQASRLAQSTLMKHIRESSLCNDKQLENLSKS